MNAGLLALAALLSPGFEEVRPCGDIEPLRWVSTLWRDPSPLFTQEAFLPETEWPDDPDEVTGGYLVRECFGTGAPHSGDVVLHEYPPAPFSAYRVRPVLLVTGAGDNALRSMSFLAVALSRAGFHVYSLTFAHNHGDNFQWAEQIANVLGEVSARHPQVKTDVIAYSKGGFATRVYASNVEGVDWSGTHDGYQAHGTRYRGDIGRLIFVGAPNGGVDTTFRWSASNLFALQPQKLNSPTSWTVYYPQTSSVPLVNVELAERSIFAEGGNHFPGQAQMVADLREMHPLPGGNPALGVYGLGPDYLTTYVGGLGFVSYSPGIEQAIEEGGSAHDRLQSLGVAEDIELHLVAGGNPILSVGGLNEQLLEAGWGDMSAAERRAQVETLADGWLSVVFPWSDEWAYDMPRLAAGNAFLGEISGPSDGITFIASALDDSGLTVRGAEVAQAHTFHALNHSELIAAGQLAADFYGDPELAGGFYDVRLSDKYAEPENQAVEWYIEVLSEPVPDMPPEPPPPPMDPPDGGLPPPELPPPGPLDDDAGPAPADGDAGVGAPEPDATVMGGDGDGRGGDPFPRVEGGAGSDAGAGATGSDKGRRFGGSCASTGAPFGAIPLWALMLAGVRRRRR